MEITTSIVIKVGDTKVKLTTSEARQLREELNKLLGVEKAPTGWKPLLGLAPCISTTPITKEPVKWVYTSTPTSEDEVIPIKWYSLNPNRGPIK